MRSPKLSILVCFIGAGALARCGSIAPDGTDAAAEAEVPSCIGAAFQAPVAILELNTPQDERDLRLTPDELHGVYACLPNINAYTLCPFHLISRNTINGTWTSAGTYTTTNPPYGPDHPSLTSDENWLFYDQIGTTAQFLTAYRDGGSAPFGRFIGLVADDPNDVPDGASVAHGVDSYVTSDGGAYYATLSNMPQDRNEIVVAHRRAPPANEVYAFAFGDPSFALVQPSVEAGAYDNPVPAADELTLYLSVSGADGIPHINVATRSDHASQFGLPMPIHELDSVEGEYPSWISLDQCRIYFTRTVGGQKDLYMATRAPQ